MAFFDGLSSALVGGAFDLLSGSATNDANLQAGREATAARAADRAALTGLFEGTTGDRITTKNAGGGLDTQFLPGSGSDVLQQGDVGRAGRVNELGDNFKFSLPTQADADAVIGKRDALNQGSFDTGLNKLISSNRRAIGPGNSQLDTSALRAVGDFVGQNRKNSPVDAINLFQGARSNDISDLQAQIQANQRQAPTLTSPASGAASVLAQNPSIAPRADLGGALLPGVGSNIVAQLQQREALQESRQHQSKILEQLIARHRRRPRGAGNQRGFNTPTLNTPTVTF